MPNPNNEDIKWLYGKLKSKGYNIGSEQEFTSSLANDADRQWYYEKAKGMGLNIGSMNDFNSLYAPAKPQPTHHTQAQPVKPQPKVAAPVHSATPQPAKPQQAAPVRQPVTYFRLRRGGKDFNVSADEVRRAGGLQAWANRHPGAPVRVYMQGNGFDGHVALSEAHNRRVQKGYKYSTTTAKEPVQTVSKPVRKAAPKAVANAMSEAQKARALANAQMMMDNVTATMHQAKEGVKNMRDYQAKAGFGNFGRTVEGAMEYNPATGKMEQTYITPQGEKTRSKAAADMSSEKFRQKEEFFGRMTENGLDPQKQEDVQRQMQLDAEKPMRDVLDNVWGEAETQDKKAQEAWRNRADKNARGFSLSDAAAASNSAGAVFAGRGEDFINDLEYQKQRHSIFDFDKMANIMYARLPEDYRNSILARYTDYFKKHPKEAKGRTAAVAAKDALMGDLYRQVYDRAKAQSMPKSRLEFLLRKIADQPLISSSMAANTVAAWQTGSYGLDLAEQDAMSVYGSRHKALNIAGTVANMALDPVTYAAGGAGGVVGKKALQIVGKQALKGATKKVAERYAAGTLAGRVAQGVAGGAANFGTFDTVKGIQQQMAVGGTLDENGKPTNELSAGDILKETAHGLMLGAATGTLSPMIGNVADKAVKATSSTAGKVAIRAGQTALSTLAEGTVFAIPDMVEKGKWDWDTWTDSQAMMLGFKASHAIKSAPRVIDALRTDGKRYGLSFEERLRKQMDASPSDIGFKPEELDELRDKGYVDLSMLFRNANNAKKNGKSTEFDRRTDPYEDLSPDTFDGYEAMKHLMNDNSVSEATRAKAYYILTGHMLPMSTVTGYTQDRADDGSVVVNSVNARGGVVTTRRFANEQAAQQEKDNIMRQAELNSVTVGEKYKETASNMMVVEQAIKEVAPDADVATVLNNYKKVKDGQLTDEAYVKQAQAIDEAIDRNRHIADPNRPEAIRENIKKETGIDVDATLRKMPTKRTEKEQAVVDEYVRSLFPEQKRNENETEEQPTADEAADAEFNNRLEQRQQSYDEGRAAFETADTEGDRSDSDAIMQRVKEAYEEIDRVFGEDAEMRLAQLEDDPWEVAQDDSLTEEQQDAVAYFINAKAAMDGLTDAANDNAENKRADIDRKVEQHTNKQTGMIHPATLKVDNRPVYIVSGKVVMFPDGSGVDKANSSESVVVCDAETGEVKFISPDMIYNVEEPISADQERQAAYDGIEAEQQVILGNDELDGSLLKPKQNPQQGDDVWVNDENGENVHGVITQVDPMTGEYMVQTDEPVYGNKVQPFTQDYLYDMVQNDNLQEPEQPESEQQEPEQPQFTQEGIDNAFNADLAQRTGADANLQSEDLQNAAAQQAQYIQQNIDNQRQQQAEADAQRHAAEEQEMAKPLYRIPKDDNGTPMLEETDPETAWDGVVQYMDDNADDASEYVNGMVTQLTKDVENAKKAVSKIKPTTDLAAFKQAKAEARQAQADAEARLEKWQQIANVNKSRQKAERDRIAAERAEADRIAHEEANARLVEQKRIEAEKKAEQEAIGTHAVNPKIKAKWDNAPKVIGNADIITLPDGSQLRGHYVLTEAGAATASHDVNNGFQPTEGFPIDENGQSVNDRDYEHDQAAQGQVRSIADNYDNRALQSPVIVSPDGIVLSGNNRTMSGDLAAMSNSDGAYNDYVRQFGQKYGFDSETLNGMQHPRVLFVPDEQLPYDAKTFARFNAQEMKSQSKPEAAVKLGKVVPDDAFRRIAGTISQYDTLSDFYNDEKASAGAIGELMSAGVVNDKQLPELRTGNALSAQGRELLENTLIGKVFQSNPNAVRQIISHPSIKQAIVMALGDIATNRTLAAKHYDLSEELANAVDLVARAKSEAPEIYRAGIPVSPYGRQHGMFDGQYGDSSVTDATTLMLADIINSNRPSDLRKVLASYNAEAVQAANGQLDMFTGSVKSKEELLKDIIKQFNNATPKEQQALVDAAIEERKRRSAESEQANASETGNGQTAPREHSSNTLEGTGDRSVDEWFGPIYNQFKGKGDEAEAYLREVCEGVAKGALTYPGISPIDIPWGDNKAGYMKIVVKHPEVVGHLQEILNSCKIKSKSDNRIVFENDTHKLIVSKMKGSTPTDNWLLTAYEKKKSVSASSSDIETEPEGKRNGTAAPQNGPSSIGKDNKSSDTEQEKKEEIASEGGKSKEDEDGLTDDERALRDRTVVNEDDWEEPGEHGPVYKRTVTIDGKHDVTQVNAPDENGDYTGAYYEYNGKRYSDLFEVTNVIDGKAPIGTTTDEATKQAERDKVNTQPSDAQKEAGNYAKGHIKVDGYDVTIENPKGSTRSGKDANGKEWSIKMNYDYGYIKGVTGVDGDHIDVYLSDNPTSGNVYVVDQIDQQTGKFDEHKVMYGFPSKEAAVEAYKSQYEKGWKVGTVTEVSREDFKKWIESSKRKTKPFADYSSVKKSETKKEPYTISPATYTNKKGKTSDMFLVKFQDELSDEQKKAAKSFVSESLTDGRRTSRGWYDRSEEGYMMRSEESAKQLAAMITDPTGEAVADEQPVTAQEYREAASSSDKTAKRTRKEPKPTNVKTVEEAVADDVKVVEHKPEPKKDELQFNGDVSKEEFNDALKNLRDLLGVGDDEGDPGILFRDGELTKEQRVKIKAAGLSVTQVLVDNGMVKFPDYAAKMVSLIGDKIRPWLKSFYEGIRWEPGYENVDFTPSDEVSKFDVENFDKPSADILKEAEMFVAEQKAKAIDKQTEQEVKADRNIKRKEDDKQREADTAAVAEEAGTVASKARTVAETTTDEQTIRDAADEVEASLEKVNNQLALLGYYKADQVEKDYNEAYGYMRNAEKKAVNDASALAKRLASDLGVDMYEATHEPANKKGVRKVRPLATANIAPAGGEVTIHLPLGGDNVLNMYLYLDPAYTDEKGEKRPSYEGGGHYRGEDLMLRGIMFRLNDGSNFTFGPDTSYGQLLRGVQHVTKGKIKQATEEVQQPAQPEVHNAFYEQYKKLKEQHPDTLLLFRVGDFYEAHFGDADLAGKELGITVTENKNFDKIAGFPHSALDEYLPKLIKAGHRVAIVEDNSIPKASKFNNDVPGIADAIAKSDDFKNLIVDNPDTQAVDAQLDRMVGDYLRSNRSKHLQIYTNRLQSGEFQRDFDKQVKDALLQKKKEAESNQQHAEHSITETPAEQKNDDQVVLEKPETWIGKTFFTNGMRLKCTDVGRGMASFDNLNTMMGQTHEISTVQNWMREGQLVVSNDSEDTHRTKPEKQETSTQEPKKMASKEETDKIKALLNSKNPKKVVSSQKKKQPSLFDDFFGDVNNNQKQNDNGLQRTDELRTEGLPADGNHEGKHPTRQSEGTSQGREGSDRQGEGTGVRGVRSSDKQPIRPRERLNQHNNHAERGKDYAPTGVDDRIEANIAAIEMMHKITDEGRQATPSEMKVLRRFSGWGGLGKAFKEPEWGSRNPYYNRLKALLSDDEWQEAEMSRNSAYFTPATVIDNLWDIARALGFKGGNVLEGSAGIGNIIGLMPMDMSDRSHIQAVEIDGTTGMILKFLYPDAKVDIQGFEQTRVPNSSVDLAITNVPFVTGLRVNDTTGDKDLSRKFHDIHDFCIAKNIRKLKPGGLGIFITSNGTLDKSTELRHWITSDGGADVVGAFRLNNETFGGTAATSDIIVVRKRVNGKPTPGAIDVSATAVERTATIPTYNGRNERIDKDFPVDYNKYFIEHPENMGGKMMLNGENGDTYRATSKACVPQPGINREKRLKDFVESMKAKAAEWDNPAQRQEPKKDAEDKVYEALGPDIKEGSMLVDKSGNLCVARYGMAVPLDVNANKVKGHTKAECFNAYKAIKDAIRDVLDYETQNGEDEGLKPLLAKLNKAYDNFVKTYGHLNKNTSISFLKNDMDFSSTAALEKYKEYNDRKGKRLVEYSKSDIFKQRVVDKATEPKPKTVNDGVITSIYKFGKLDLAYIAGQLGMSEDAVKQEIISSGLGFEDPVSHDTLVAFDYLSGNVREKLYQAQQENSNGQYDGNIKALRKVIPMDIPAHLIDFTLGSSWIAPKLYEEYIKERTDIDVKLSNIDGTWAAHMPEYGLANDKNRQLSVKSEICDKTIWGHELIVAALRNKNIFVSKSVKHYDGTTETITDKDATQLCADRIDEIRQDFKDWARNKMQQNTNLSKRYEKIYNDQFNNYVPKEIPDDFVPEYFTGATHAITLRAHQAKAAIRGTMQNLMLAHEVGSGKTFTLISTAMEMRRLGTAKKPMIVVQNATVGQFVASAKFLYPNAKILTLEDEDRNVEGRKAFYAKIKYNDWDMIVIPQSVLNTIPDSNDRQIAFINDKIAEKEHVLEAMQEAGIDDKIMQRRAEKELENLQTEKAAVVESSKKKHDEKKVAVARQNAKVRAQEMLDRKVDDVEDFDDMGIDALLVDEAHEYKHLGFTTAMTRGVKGVDSSDSKKCQGVYLKCQSVMERTGGKNIIFATGTPISNTAAEIWTFMKYLLPADTMREYGIYYFDDFVRNFGMIEQKPEFKTSGKFEPVNRFRGYLNLPELVRIWSGVSDTVLSADIDDLQAKIPVMEGGKAKDVYLPQTRSLRSVMKYVRKRLSEYEQMSGKKKKEHSDIPLTMYGIAQGAAIDPRLVVDNAEDDPNSKTNASVKEILRALNDSKEHQGAVCLFSDRFENKKTGFNVFEDIKQKLVAAGVPGNQIVIIKGGMKMKQKTAIFDKVNAGEIRVVMGTTKSLGTGVNMQERMFCEIHLDAPNRPMDYTQRMGRILRQGNLHKEWGIPVRVIRFGVEDSLDVTAYQRLKTKGAIAYSIMHGKSLMENNLENRTLEEEDDQIGDTIANLSGSQYALLKQSAERDVRKYESRYKQWEADQVYIHRRIPDLEGEIKYDKSRIAQYDDALKLLDSKKVQTGITIGKKQFSNVEAMADFFKDYNKSIKADEDKIRNSYSSDKVKRDMDMTIDGFTFHVTTTLGKETENRQGSLFDVVRHKMTYSCDELGLKDVPVKQGLLRNAVEDITQNVLTGDDFRSYKDSAQDVVERNSKELEQMRKREGKPFEFGPQLEDAKQKLEEYTDKMEKELAEKEAKYAEIDKEVDEANVDEEADDDSDDVHYRDGDDNSINAVNEQFNEELQDQIDGLQEPGHIYQLGNPSPILRSTGIPDLPIQLSATRLLEKATRFGHDFELQDVRGLVNALQHPLAIFAYGNKERAQNIIVEIEKDGKNFVVGLSLRPTVNGHVLEINSIRNVFPKNNSEWLNWISQGKALYINKEKVQDLIDKQRTILADVDYLDLNSIAKIIKGFDNPVINSENLSTCTGGYDRILSCKLNADSAIP